MRIGIPKENHNEERRVALTPAGVDALTRSGQAVTLVMKIL
jgi:alanine dehydrogenase